MRSALDPRHTVFSLDKLEPVVPRHDLIVVGGSAGAIEAVSALVAGLPFDLPAAVCVVVHLRPDADTRLAAIIGRATSLPVVSARDGMALRRGTIHVAVPDLHLLVERGGTMGVTRLARGPRENRARPAVDPLFRSAALAYGSRVVGVVLSGALDDGTAGLWTVRDRGGIAVVQDPEDAAVSGMPRSALTDVRVDHVAHAAELGPLLGRLAREPAVVPARSDDGAPSEIDPADELETEVEIAAMDEEAHQRSVRYGYPSRFSCPECGGVLWDVSFDGPVRFRCEVGHAHSAASLAEAQTESVEAALWVALRSLEDRIALARRRGAVAAERGLASFVTQYAVQQQAAEQHAAALRALLRLDGRIGIRPRVGVGEDRIEPRPADVRVETRSPSAGAADAVAGVAQSASRLE